MRYGVLLNLRGPAATSASIVTSAVWADRLGYDTVWVSDHVVVPEQFSSQYPYGPPGTWTLAERQNFFEPFTVLAYVAGATRGVRVGTGVLVAPQRNPVLMGKMFATLDVLSGGRVVIGVGAGWLREEFEALGAGHLFAQRGAVTDEWLQIWKVLWTQETSTYQGRFFSLPPVRAFPKPVQRPHPPILIGGNGRGARRRAVRLGDGWHPARPALADLRTGVADLRALAEAAGRPLSELQIGVRLNLRLGEPARGPGELAGSPDEVRAQVAELAELGLTNLDLDFSFTARRPHDPLNLESIERFAALVGLTPRG
ncbi:MAG: TIGR03619 family F420-dependent LLM class oxidoreductase [Chloroflexi bacterium]|nr:TIGR03619 family F420-dependent LLM class oxidoreductase [Chloroflexota bacterium]